MRIVAGSFRGRRLAAPRGRDVRPTSDRVREAIFNILGPIDGAAALDLFAGTGAMGLEAISRGAVHATFVELDRQALDVVHRNIDATISDDEHSVTVIKGDAVRTVRSLAMQGTRFDLVFVDPPYDRTEEMIDSLGPCLGGVCHQDSRIVLELSTRHSTLVDAAVEAWGAVVNTARRYGDTTVAVLEFAPTGRTG